MTPTATLPVPGTPRAQSQAVRMTRYRLVVGYHVEPDGTEQGRLINTGDVFESPNSWYVDKWPEKFTYAENPADSSSGYIWNPTKESLEQFMARMKEVAAPNPANPASTVNPTTPVNPAQLAAAKKQQQITELDAIAAMNAEELRRYADEEEIDVKRVKKGTANERDELMKIILGTVPAPAK